MTPTSSPTNPAPRRLFVDINADLGEGAGSDAELMPLVTSANIACGAHAGDEASMREAVSLALRHGVALGAHPGFADRQNFGRRELPVSPAGAASLVSAQVGALALIAAGSGATLTHVKPHGALYAIASRDRAIADAIAGAVFQSDPRLILVGLSGGRLLEAGRARGLRVASEAFADRSYEPDGSLTPRGIPGALLASPGAALEQAVRLLERGTVLARGGTEVPVEADTLCIHGDGPHALELARKLRAALAAAGFGARPLASFLR